MHIHRLIGIAALVAAAAAGTTFAQGQAGVSGTSLSSLGSINDLDGLTCSSGGDAGTIAVSTAADGNVTFKCKFTTRGPVLRINEVMTASAISAASEFVDSSTPGASAPTSPASGSSTDRPREPRRRRSRPSRPARRWIRELATSSAARLSGDSRTRPTTVAWPRPRWSRPAQPCRTAGRLGRLRRRHDEHLRRGCTCGSSDGRRQHLPSPRRARLEQQLG